MSLAGNPIRLLNTCRTASANTTSVFQDAFGQATIDTAQWTHGGWSLGGSVSDGLPVVQLGYAATDFSPMPNLKTAVLVDKVIAAQGYREVAVIWHGYPGARIYLMLDMNDTTPDPDVAGYMAVIEYEGTLDTTLIKLYRDGAVVRTSGIPPHTIGLTERFVLSIKDTNAVTVRWDGKVAKLEMAYLPPTYTAAGTRTGFAISAESAQVRTTVSQFTHYYSTASGTMPSSALMASSGGSLYYESTNGNMILVNTALTLASDQLLSTARHLERLFIADYALRTHSTSGNATTSAGAGGYLEDTSADFTTDGVDVQDDILEILSGTWNGVADAGLGTFLISAVTATRITVGAAITINANTGSGVTYRVVRAPKVFDSDDQTLTTIVASNGFVPAGFTIVTEWLGRLVWSGNPIKQHAILMSKVGEPEDYNYGNDADGVHVAWAMDPSLSGGSAQLSDRVTALIPHNNDYLVIGCTHSVFIQAGNPAEGNRPEAITNEIGILGHKSWCYTPNQTIVAMTPDGLYEFVPAPNVEPTRMSRERLPEELLAIDMDLYNVTLEYNTPFHGIDILVTPKTADRATHWFFGWATKEFFPMSFPSGFDPTASTTHAVGNVGIRRTILGGRDGYLRVFDENAYDDDGTNFESHVLIGPIMLGGDGYHEGILREVIGQLSTLSGSMLLSYQVGDSIESAYNAAPRGQITLRAGKSLTATPRLRGNACFIRLDGIPGTAWALEQLTLLRERLGKQRLLS
jgi:hypothetical protein